MTGGEWVCMQRCQYLSFVLHLLRHAKNGETARDSISEAI